MNIEPLHAPTISALSTLSGVSEQDAAVQAALILTFLVGPRAGLVTMGGEFQPVGANMISVAGDSPGQARLSRRRTPPGLLEELSTKLADTICSNPGKTVSVCEEEIPEAMQKHVGNQAIASTAVTPKSDPIERFEEFWREEKKTPKEKDDDRPFASMCPFAAVNYEYVISLNASRCLHEPTVFESPSPDVLLRHLN